MARSKELDIGDIWLFSACSASQLRMIRRQVEEVTVEPGTMLCEEGAVGREFFFIVDGTATVRRHGRKIATLGNGQYFGELSLLDRRPRSATVVSESAMTVLVLDQRRFNGLLDAIPSLSHKLLVAMAERIREADTKSASY
ncbi:MAG TPA: cyclic nucleotide-binding domain-containing protein [Acidimicrobiales bacterium]|nr:cyclic nucleotide-binding domain-containing protein [Acidimicrobiales bacterium]